MTQWRDISTAPRDGSVIVSNEGTCKWMNQPRSYWYLCDGNGSVPFCAEYGQEISQVEPTGWLPVEASVSHNYAGPPEGYQ